jgi:uncharacterized membrane protein
MEITPFGWFHTGVSVIAVVAGIVAFVRDKEISPQTSVGKTYVVMTVLSCLTGFFIFHHPDHKFGPGHALGIVTLVVLAIAGIAGKTHVFGRASRYVETIGYSLTFFFHMIPTLTEGSTRLPVGHPLVPGPDAPPLQAAIGVVFLIFLIGAALQIRRLHAEGRLAQPA